jgi:FixJ family two-component response regulator
MDDVATGRSSNVRPLRRARVLVVSRDRRFLQSTGFVLARNGFLVERSERFADVPALVDRYRPTAVVIDVSDSISTAMKVVAALEGASPQTRVVVVSEPRDGDGAGSVDGDFVAKWSSESLLAQLGSPQPAEGNGGGP